MKEVFEKLKGRLEIESDNADDKIIEKVLIEDMRYWDGYGDGVDKAIEIVNQVAEEYKHGHFGCNSNGQHERCVDCGLRGECSHYNTEWFAEYSNSEISNMSDVPDKNVGSNDGWIPCSERLPEDNDNVNVTILNGNELETATAYYDCKWFVCPKDDYDFYKDRYEVFAWKPFEVPYKPKGENNA